MTDQEQRFLVAAKKYEALKEQMDAVREELNAAMLEIGYDKYVQDTETSIVYKVIKPGGTFIYYREIDYKRTAKEGERGGTVLAKSEAEGAGFKLKK